MWLYGGRVLRLRENLQQLIVREEVEARERVALSLQVIAQSLLYLFQQLVALTQIVKETVVRA